VSALDFGLLNDFQRDFPLCPEPYRAIAARLSASPEAVMERLAALRLSGAVSRIGAVLRPGAVGASTLAAMVVPPQRLAAVARAVSDCPGVNHNYEREHTLNLWFVAAAADASALQRLLSSIEGATGIEVLSLPLVEEYHIDLGFDLSGAVRRRTVTPRQPRPTACSEEQRRLIAALQDGLELVARPYAALGERAGLSESGVIAQLQIWIDRGDIRRFGVVVRHLELGWAANAMCAWDVPDAMVRSLGERLASQPEVTLCYRRARCAPRWRHNLYCMIHGRERGEVERTLARLRHECGLADYDNEVLFSTRPANGAVWTRLTAASSRNCSAASRCASGRLPASLQRFRSTRRSCSHASRGCSTRACSRASGRCTTPRRWAGHSRSRRCVSPRRTSSAPQCSSMRTRRSPTTTAASTPSTYGSCLPASGARTSSA
jgi:siroheme decarboxylase